MTDSSAPIDPTKETTATAGERVTITAVDWNGTSFDGSPFEPAECAWILPFIQSGHVAPYQDYGSRDYMIWSVLTPGGRLIAYPGDQIHHIDGNLVLTQDPGNRHEDRVALHERVQWRLPRHPGDTP